MSRRNSPNAIPDLGEPSRLPDFVFDKRQSQRASAKRHRRNRHYEKQFIRNTLAHPPQPDRAAATHEHGLASPLAERHGKGIGHERAARRHRDVPPVRPRDPACTSRPPSSGAQEQRKTSDGVPASRLSLPDSCAAHRRRAGRPVRHCGGLAAASRAASLCGVGEDHKPEDFLVRTHVRRAAHDG
jgi:hypothetical protein